MGPGRDPDQAIRWVRAYWKEPDLPGPLAVDLDASSMEFLYELDAAGHALRSIELTGKDRVPIAASNLAHLEDRPREDHSAHLDDGSA